MRDNVRMTLINSGRVRRPIVHTARNRDEMQSLFRYIHLHPYYLSSFGTGKMFNEIRMTLIIMNGIRYAWIVNLLKYLNE